LIGVKFLNSLRALEIVEAMVADGRVVRVSSSKRRTKAVIFRTAASARHFAVEVNDVVSRSYAQQVKLVFERKPNGNAIDWSKANDIEGVATTDRQFKNSAYTLKGARLEYGKQMALLVASEQAVRQLIDWYASVAGQATMSVSFFNNHQKVQPERMSLPVQSATNLILYGPPGTGKTYETAAAAVRLCIGEAQAAPLLAEERRADLMATYRMLADAGRIEFVTFHQSYSYEDFVEGLRPTTDPAELPGEALGLTANEEAETGVTQVTGGFRLRSEDGVFKRICRRARQDRGDRQNDHRLDRERPVFKMALGRRGIEENRIAEGLSKSLIHLGWGGDIDWSDERFDDFEEIRREWREQKDGTAGGKDPNIEMTFSFRSQMQIGDYVLTGATRYALLAG
jgi:hypothetical protein